MAGIEDLITLYRGEAPSRFDLDFGDLRGTYYTKDKDLAKYMAQGGKWQYPQHTHIDGYQRCMGTIY
jgi:hypothetical protein